MPLIPDMALEVSGNSVRRLVPEITENSPSIVRRINVPYNSLTAPPGLIQAETVDPWFKSGKYALGWVYFCIILLVLTVITRLYHLWTDKVRTALHQDQNPRFHSPTAMSPLAPAEHTTAGLTPIDMPCTDTDRSITFLWSPKIVPQVIPESVKEQSSISSFAPLNYTIALFRYLFYRPLPMVKLHKRWRPLTFPSLPTLVISLAALTFTVLYCFVPQPLYWQSIRFGSPPVAIRSGMLAVSMMPWLIALSVKANMISMLTGIGHERLNVLHRWGGWLCLFMSLVHTIPFYITPIWDHGGSLAFRSYFGTGIYIYGTGIAALVPLCFLCLHSISFLRHWMYELFVALHVPAAIVFLAMMFWHCNNYLTSWSYLFATVGIWIVSYLVRILYLNWTNPWRVSWLIGDDASVHILPENALKVTIPTQMRWKPGQYVYLRMPGISIFENHPFTIASLCSNDFPSEYGEQYRDMSLVFRPYGGFTKKVLERAFKKGPWHTYRAFLDGPYGGMRRPLEAFDTVVLLAGGSGITALTSHLLDLIKRMRDAKAVTKKIMVLWALKRPESMEWFKEELRICRECAPTDSIEFQFFITSAKRQPTTGQLVSAETPSRPVGDFFHDKVNGAFQEIANKRYSRYSEISTGRHSALIKEEAAGDSEKEEALRREVEDRVSALPEAHLREMNFSHAQPLRPAQEKRWSQQLQLDIDAANRSQSTVPKQTHQDINGFNFGFPTTPTEFQKNLMRFAFLPAAVRKRGGWSTEYGRPDIPYMLRQFSNEFGRRTCVFVCGPPSMRIDVSRSVAQLQSQIFSDPAKEEIYLHAENYAI